MTEEQAMKILRPWIVDGGLEAHDPIYIQTYGSKLVVDGNDVTVEILEALTWWMKNRAPQNAMPG